MDNPFNHGAFISLDRVAERAGGLEQQLDAPELAARVEQLTVVVRDFLNGVETGGITSEHYEVFNNLVDNARRSIA